MKLLGVFVIFLVIGVFISYGIGAVVEQWSSTASMTVFLACFFFMFWAAWQAAVKVTA